MNTSEAQVAYEYYGHRSRLLCPSIAERSVDYGKFSRSFEFPLERGFSVLCSVYKKLRLSNAQNIVGFDKNATANLHSCLSAKSVITFHYGHLQAHIHIRQ